MYHSYKKTIKGLHVIEILEEKRGKYLYNFGHRICFLNQEIKAACHEVKLWWKWFYKIKEQTEKTCVPGKLNDICSQTLC